MGHYVDGGGCRHVQDFVIAYADGPVTIPSQLETEHKECLTELMRGGKYLQAAEYDNSAGCYVDWSVSGEVPRLVCVCITPVE